MIKNEVETAEKKYAPIPLAVLGLLNEIAIKFDPLSSTLPFPPPMSTQENAAASIIGLTTECVITGLYSAGECRALPTDPHVREAMREEARACGKNMMEEKKSEAGAVQNLVEACQSLIVAMHQLDKGHHREVIWAEAALTPFQQKR